MPDQLTYKEAGVDIARRTVAKYREAMRIPSSVQRRREKRAFEAAGSPGEGSEASKAIELSH